MKDAFHFLSGNKVKINNLIKLYNCYIKNKSFVCSRVSQVCRLWRIVASDPLLWTNIDLAGRWVSKNPIRNDINFRWLCENRLTKVQELNLGKYSKLHLIDVSIKFSIINI